MTTKKTKLTPVEMAHAALRSVENIAHDFKREKNYRDCEDALRAAILLAREGIGLKPLTATERREQASARARRASLRRRGLTDAQGNWTAKGRAFFDTSKARRRSTAR